MGTVAIVGAGVVGLTAAEALGRRGHSVTTFDPEPPGSGQSFGRVRAFRIAHPTPAGVGMAAASLSGWDAWEQVWGSHLLDRHGLLLCDPDRDQWAVAMKTAGQPFRLPNRSEARELCPLVDPAELSVEHLLFDPQAAAIDVRSTIEFLVAAASDHGWRHERCHVSDVRQAGTHARLDVDGRTHDFDAALVCAGAGTDELAAHLGLHLDTQQQQRTWAAIRPRSPLPPTAMWMETMPDHRYGWAQIGPDGVAHLSGDWSSNNPDDTSAGSMAVALEYARRLMPALDPGSGRPEEMQVAPVSVPGGMPFAVSSVGAITLIEGNQLFKFGPLLGEILADAVEGRARDGVPVFPRRHRR